MVVLAQRILPEVHLDPAAGVFEVREARLSMGAETTDSAGDLDPGSLVPHVIPVLRQCLGGSVAPLVAVGVCRYSQPLELGPLLPAGCLDVGAFLRGAHRCLRRFPAEALEV